MSATLLAAQSTDSAKNITSILELATFTASGNQVVRPSVRLSGLNGAAATITLYARHYAANGTTLIRAQAISFPKPTATSTVAGDDFPAAGWLILDGEKLTIAAISTNASDTSVAFAIDWLDGTAANVTQWLGSAVSASAAGRPSVNVAYWNNLAVVTASGFPSVNAERLYNGDAVAAQRLAEAFNGTGATITGTLTGNVGGIAGTIQTLDALDTAQDSQHSTTQSSLSTVLSRLGSWAGTGRNTILGALQSMFRSDADATVPSDINEDLGAGAGTADQTTDSLQAQADAEGGGDATLAKQNAIIALLGSASITVNGPLTSATTIELVQQDDYNNDDGRAITFTGTFSGEDITGATVNFRVADRFTGTNLIDITNGTVVTATGTQAVRVQLTSAQVALLVKSGETYRFHCRLLHDTRKITVAQGKATVLASLFAT